MDREEQIATVFRSLEKLSVPMQTRTHTREEYNKLFPQGTAQTPIATVKLGKDLFDKINRKDDGKRQNLLGALYQTLSDPIAIIKEGSDDVYIKSFTKSDKQGVFVVLSVEKDENDERVVVTIYRRKMREVKNKINQPRRRAAGVWLFLPRKLARV
jgi:hypothetical protein